MKLGWRQSILYIAALGTEGCWLHALLALLNIKVAGGHLSVLGILLLYPASFLFNWLLRRLRWPKVCLWSVSWLAWAVSMLLMIKVQLFGHLPLSDPTWILSIPRSIVQVIYTFRPELLILLSTGVLWWLGQRLAYLRVNFTTMVSEFQFGLPILVFIFLIASPLEVTLNGTVPITLTFFLFALLGISVAHALERTSWLSGLNQGHWGGLLLFSIGLVLVLGLLISSVVTPDLLQLLLAAIKWAWGLIINAIAFLASLFPEPGPVEPLPMPLPVTEPMVEPDFSKFFSMPELLRQGLRIAWGVLFAGFILFALWRVSSDIFRWLHRRLAGMAGAEFEPLPGAFRTDFVNLLKRILLKLLSLRLPRLGIKASSFSPEMASVRQIYRRLLRWAATGGFPRHRSQTPHEYYYTLASLLPEAQDDLNLITQQYIRTRYGTWLPTEDELNQLRHSWLKLK
ncbi:DUF4129 domain-containing protein [Chloroflexota bacterium]